MRLIPYILFSLLLLIGGIALHEITHGQIMEYFDVPYYYTLFDGDAIAAVRYSGANCNDICLLANSINEIAGYTIMPFLIIIIMVLIVRWDNLTIK